VVRVIFEGPPVFFMLLRINFRRFMVFILEGFVQF